MVDSVSTDLGVFLRSRRALVDPRTAGFPYAGVRRVPGLRREEVAVLAGVSSDYYTKLEQGREDHPSAQILEALARTFDLSEDERRYLYGLAGLVPKRGSGHGPTAVDPQLLRLMDGWSATPTIILSATLDVLARNQLARALYAGFTLDDNLLRMTFLDPEGRRFYQDWDRAAEASVANLRAASANERNEAPVRSLVAELTAGAPAFKRLWEQQTVRGKTHEPKSFHHAEVGPLTLTYQAFDVRGAPGQQLIVYDAEPGSRSADALRLLGSVAASLPQPGATSRGDA
jgi:transcriptional regulator with XRE-family HTH domain